MSLPEILRPKSTRRSAPPRLPAYVPPPPTAPKEPSDVLTPREAAELLRIHLETLYDLCRRGQVPHWRQGRLLRFSRAALLALVAGSPPAGGAEAAQP